MVDSPVDMAKTYMPHTILLWARVAEHPEARRIVGMFPNAQVKVVERQRDLAVVTDMNANTILSAKRTLLIGETSRFVHRFDGGLGRSVRCRAYLKLVPVSNGCPYRCTYCYLAYVYREHLPAIKVNVNEGTMFKQIRKAVGSTAGAVAFNMGEMLDSLALDHVTQLTTKLMPLFADLTRGYLMLLTKSANIDGLLQSTPTRQVVVSWSLNARQMIEKFEEGTASLRERIAAARQCQQRGYRIRFRIDPGVLYPGWEGGYADLVRQMLEATEPENITLGLLRLVPGHFRLAARVYGQAGRDLQREDLTERASDGKLRYRTEKRITFYRFLIDMIRSFDREVSISLCRETPSAWYPFRHICTSKQCNCMAW